MMATLLFSRINIQMVNMNYFTFFFYVSLLHSLSHRGCYVGNEMTITLELDYWRFGRWLFNFNSVHWYYFKILLGKKIYKDSSEDISIVNNNFDNLPDTIQVIKGTRVFQSGGIKKRYGKVLVSKSAKPHR